MINLHLFGFHAEVDKEKTQSWYAQSSGWSCPCGHCRNFIKLAKDKQLPQPMMESLDILNIAYEKATYVCELFTDNEGIHYQVSYRLAGTILSVPDEAEITRFNLGRCCHEPYPYGAPDFPSPHFDLEFWITLPWCLDE